MWQTSPFALGAIARALDARSLSAYAGTCVAARDACRWAAAMRDAIQRDRAALRAFETPRDCRWRPASVVAAWLTYTAEDRATHVGDLWLDVDGVGTMRIGRQALEIQMNSPTPAAVAAMNDEAERLSYYSPYAVLRRALEWRDEVSDDDSMAWASICDDVIEPARLRATPGARIQLDHTSASTAWVLRVRGAVLDTGAIVDIAVRLEPVGEIYARRHALARRVRDIGGDDVRLGGEAKRAARACMQQRVAQAASMRDDESMVAYADRLARAVKRYGVSGRVAHR